MLVGAIPTGSNPWPRRTRCTSIWCATALSQLVASWGGTIFGYKGIGRVIHKRVKVGRNCIIGQQATIGGRSGHYGVPVIGDNREKCTGAKVLGPIKSGNNVTIGAYAVMITDAPDNTVWAGVPARCIKTIDTGQVSPLKGDM